jgi:hypothetical protein
MAKEDTKENIKETQRVFVENLPKPKGWLKENAGIIIALLALAISLYSAYLSREEFIAAHRPYVYATPRIEEKTGVMDLYTVTYSCLNAPAKIDNVEIYYEIFKNGEEESRKIPWNIKRPRVLYPSEKLNSQTTTRYDFKKEISDPNVNLIRRKVKINYKELSGNRTYYFEGYWDYNKEYDIWEDNNVSVD